MPPTIIAISVVEQEGRFLVGQRENDSVLPGLMEFPGGKVGPHEAIESAAVRECLEETGLEVQVVRHEMTCCASYQHGQVELHFFRCRVAPTTCPRAAPKTPFRWVTKEALFELEFPAGNREMLAQIGAE